MVTACGIFVKDILDAVPIDKYFEMFKPGTGQEGGFVRLKMSILSEEEMSARKRGAPRAARLCTCMRARCSQALQRLCLVGTLRRGLTGHC